MNEVNVLIPLQVNMDEKTKSIFNKVLYNILSIEESYEYYNIPLYSLFMLLFIALFFFIYKKYFSTTKNDE